MLEPYNNKYFLSTKPTTCNRSWGDSKVSYLDPISIESMYGSGSWSFSKVRNDGMQLGHDTIDDDNVWAHFCFLNTSEVMACLWHHVLVYQKQHFSTSKVDGS